MKRVVWPLVAAVLAVAATLVTPATATIRSRTSPPIGHVFIIVLENKTYDETFGPNSPAKYLSTQLPAQGQLLRQYYGTGHFSLDNYITMVSGQAPNIETQGDCQFYTDVVPGVVGPNDQAIGQGCVYPSSVKTVADQLQGAGLTWKGYMEDMGNAAPAQPATCRHPAPNTQDSTQQAKKGDQYAARHNPFVYFHSLLDSGSCQANDVPLDRLPADLSRVATTPNYTFITPNLCNDGHDAPCVDGKPGGLKSADEFLKKWVPQIMASPAYQQDGLLVVGFDEAEATPPNQDSTACCNEPTGFNTPMPGQTGPGGGRMGAVVLSRFVKPGTVNDTPYNHYSLLRSVEDLFGVGHLGYAGQDGLKPFGTDVYNNFRRGRRG